MSEYKSERIIRLRKVIEITGLSRTTIYNLINTDSFIPKIQITSRAVGFLENDLNQWIAERVSVSKVYTETFAKINQK